MEEEDRNDSFYQQRSNLSTGACAGGGRVGLLNVRTGVTFKVSVCDGWLMVARWCEMVRDGARWRGGKVLRPGRSRALQMLHTVTIGAMPNNYSIAVPAVLLVAAVEERPGAPNLALAGYRGRAIGR